VILEVTVLLEVKTAERLVMPAANSWVTRLVETDPEVVADAPYITVVAEAAAVATEPLLAHIQPTTEPELLQHSDQPKGSHFKSVYLATDEHVWPVIQV
jgi:hypothetical protein